ncbi:cell envelope integrity protein CreD [Candidatus Falkowbacteria bacterium]|nr:cell envelope integrity protein CreD [Candidatus Falkowbacteria bacterium]
MTESNSSKSVIMIKLVVIGFLVFILMIPALSIMGLVQERQSRRDEAVKEVTSKWGDKQTLVGPILTVPYKVKEENVETVKYANFLPENLNIAGNLEPKMLNRGIYNVTAYKADLKFEGKFLQPNFQELNIPASSIIWQDAYLSIGFPDMRGLNENIVIKWNGKDYQAMPNSGSQLLTYIKSNITKTENLEQADGGEQGNGYSSPDEVKSGASVRIPLNATSTPSAAYNYSFAININGGEQLNFVPIGGQTNVTLTSSWQNPSFGGAFIPTEREINKDGFKAQWKILELNRNFGQNWLGNSDSTILGSTFGVRLIVPVDEYQKNMRSVKYAIMLIVLSFIIFFFVEVFNEIRIHPIQYLLVGFALLLFFTLLLSISEHLGFNLAYLIASFATISLVVFYVKNIFKSTKLTSMLGGILVLIYLFIFTIIQLQDYALLMGSIGLFIVLSLVMLVSRKVNWYAIEVGKGTAKKQE